MAHSSTDSVSAAHDADLWNSLKRAIANSSGFQSWRSEQSFIPEDKSVEQLVRLYLRETLETLAY
ncbi:MAG: hypothetical protein DCF25_06205 [Leptolyngbya foveolarum]|uniref:Uncharacterized protein n=1 Tax=Leptolyngbya foveolarum TaxID=47253 RepID=A0A2W4UN47_9CYAN|nr:MAG: hypothetical protein DCF25_06205 [Leptolyngbya foveolarum]